MPELPEVETVRRQLEPALVGRRFVAVGQIEPFMLRDVSPEELRAALPGTRVESVSRRGKFLLIALSSGDVMTAHLGMTGQLLATTEPAPMPAHARFVFTLGRAGRSASAVTARRVSAQAGIAIPPGVGELRLVFNDPRKFGRLHLTRGPAPRLGMLGPDALNDDWDRDDLAAALAGRRAPLKAFLLDQRHLAGVGNIYADEILFAAGLSPLRSAGSLSDDETDRLAGQIRERLVEGVRLRGCSISDYVDLQGRKGSFQEVLQAYGRHGQECRRCGGKLIRVIVAGRGTAYCPDCQH
jgi:formamidopyrimidine-DNA glycosylase